MLEPLDAGESRDLRDFFRDSGYTIQALTSRFGSLEISSLHLLKLYLLGVPLEPSRLNILLRWFWIGSEVEAGMVREFIPAPMLALLVKARVVRETGASAASAASGAWFESTVRISPFGDLLVASDHAVSREGALRSDAVSWPNPTTLLSDQMTMRSSFGRTLDLGTGNGILALRAASHSGHVVATDINRRAREFFAFNAALNGVANAEFREGSGFEPVRGERFDLILVNPPFFITPSVRRVFSDNDMELDGFCRMLLGQAPELLNPDGYCQMLMEWVQVKGQPWKERLAEWCAGLGCDVWVMNTYHRSAADYAMIRVQEDREETASPADQAALSTEWQAYFESRQVEAIFGGIVVLRRRDGRNWMRIEELAAMPARPFGDFLRRVFANRDYLEQHADDQLLASRPVLASSARLKKQFALANGGWKLAAVDLQLAEGLPYSLAVQPQVADFLALCDGKRTLGEIADQLAAALSVDAAMVRRESCAIVRQVADRGMMVL